MPTELPTSIRLLADRYDASVLEPAPVGTRIRILGAGPDAVDLLLDGAGAVPARGGGRPAAVLSADERVWDEIAADARRAGAGGAATAGAGPLGVGSSAALRAFNARRLRIRYDLHLGVGFLAATAAAGPGRLRFVQVQTAVGPISILEAGTGDGPPVVMVHGLGATKMSFLPTVAALSESHRAIAIDLPGFGDSAKPIGAGYDPDFFARSVVALLDALAIDRAHVVGNSMGGRVALEVGLQAPDRVARLGLLCPSLAWLRGPPFAPLLRLVAPELGLIQPIPRLAVETMMRMLDPGWLEHWTMPALDEFMRSYLTPRGRAAFYASARNIYLEEPHGPTGLWTRLTEMEPPCLFVWGQFDPLVPIGFARHVRRVLPEAEHLELDCGHVPQLERPGPPIGHCWTSSRPAGARPAAARPPDAPDP